MEFVDIAGLVKGASEGEGLGNQFLANIREVDAIVHVVRCFEDADVQHVMGSVDPVRDREIINIELGLADLASVEKRLDKAARAAKSGDPQAKIEQRLLEQRAARRSRRGGPRAPWCPPAEEAAAFRGVQPAHVQAGALRRQRQRGRDVGQRQRASSRRCARRSPPTTRPPRSSPSRPRSRPSSPSCRRRTARTSSTSLGLTESGLDRLAHAAYHLLGLQSYFTAGEKEVRAWTIHRGDKAPAAAGVIHSDFEKGFIRAETVAYDDFVRAGGWKGAREQGLARAEGKEYVVQDGDVMLFRFSA